MPAQGIKVIDTVTETTFDDRGKPVEKMRVQFRVDEHGPFFLRFDVEGFTGFAAKQKLEEFARDYRVLKD